VTRPAILALADGSVFEGEAIGAEGSSVGEVVFNTAMTGYQEILTDPSYAKQMVTLTYPHIGNTGVTAEDEESRDVFAAGLIIRDLPLLHSNYRAEGDLGAYLARKGVVAIAGIDTRKLTRILRDRGAQHGCLMAAAEGTQIDHQAAIAAAAEFPGMVGLDLASVVSTDAAYSWTEGSWRHPDDLERTGAPIRFKVVAYDYGVKRNILRLLVDAGCEIEVVPAETPAAEVMARKPDGVFLSNGPGDPEPCDYAITAIREIIDAGIPTFGICLGHQLLGLASGGKTVKMKFGHHGANHPVQDLDSKRVLITSQNHGFAVDEVDLPANLRATHRSLFDGSLQGVERVDAPAFSFQGHPEASPGPHDMAPLFQRFINMMQEAHDATS
jgi:carbamoyl-phosphate synthase small subunit